MRGAGTFGPEVGYAAHVVVRRLLLVLVSLIVVLAGGVYWLLSSDAVRRSLESQASAWLGVPISIERASARLLPRLGVHLENVRIGSPAHVTLALVDLSTDLRALLSRRVEQADVVIADSRITLPLAFVVPTDGARAAASGGPRAMTVGSIRTISLRNVRLVSRGRELAVSAASSLDGTRLNVQHLTARSGDTSIDAWGVVELSPRIDATLEAHANQLDLDDLLAVVDAFSPSRPASPRGAALPGRISAKVIASSGTAAGVELGNLTATVVAQNDRITLAPIAFQLFGGRYNGTFDVDARETLTVALTGQVRDLDVAQLAEFGRVENTVKGRLSGSGRFNGRGRDVGGVLASAIGTGSVVITDGTIRGLDLVRRVVLFFGRSAAQTPESSGDHFERISAVFSVANQVVTSDTLTMNSPDLDVVARGTLTVPTEAFDVRADLVLSESLSKRAGTDFYRYTREGNRIVLPAIVSGTVSQPAVRIDAAAAIRRRLGNEVERQLKGLLDRLKLPSQP